ncbi:hypothetical protein NEF87_000634 [Candidatus Lokiarchaeum ossiferum]|uniref:GTP-binding protein n=1 Tax=Candidatus Lokiarchaeum ossiferum TaxID=2951803 RepID=A0ABY6HLG4_9ARCH|nr:hypothetical protein NEF87_000634 [Candidatus Lokiarchaeum sp. B-35]
MNEKKKTEIQKKAQDIPDDPKKIAVVGLMAAGKTSLLKTLFRQFDAVLNITPTRKVERSVTEFLHHKLALWDFGGQDRYTLKYLESPDLYFKKIAQLFYVVDCQNSDWIEKSLTYFKNVVEAVKKFSPDANITILYNKIDPDFPNQDIIEKNMSQFKEQAHKILNCKGFGYQAYRTSKDVPVWVITAFSKSMLDNPQIFDEISSQLGVFSETHDLDAAIVFTPEGFGLGYHISPKFNAIEIRDLFIKFFTKFEQMYNIMPVINLQFEGLNIYSTRFYLDEVSSKLPLYFGLIYKKELQLESISTFIRVLKQKTTEI